MTDPVSNREVRLLDVDLTRDEVEQKAAALARALQDKLDLESEAKRLAADFKERVKQVNEKAFHLMACVRTHREPREVECMWRRNMAAKTAELYRLDEGTVVESRPLGPGERQGNLFPIDGGREDISS